MPRPPSYERAAVLQKATDIFWGRGYGATSISDLVAATGLKPGSIYAAFGSKKGLFLEVLDRYHEDFLQRIDRCTAAAPTPLAAVRALLERAADDTAADCRQRGCLAVNTLLEMAQHDADIAGNLRAGNERLRRRVEKLLAAAQAAGEIGPGKDTATLSLFLMNNLWGMRVMCKSAPSRQALDGIVAGVMAALGCGAPRGAAAN